ncbi:MAG: oxidoreductase [Holophagales bacterium]|nr:oxidoreductase [Holophagales bacterium]
MTAAGTWRFLIDVAKCEDCNNCLLACKDEHVGNHWPGVTLPQPRRGARWMNVVRKERGQYPHVDVAYRPTPCQHCADAPCVAASGGAIARRPDGIVLIDPDKAKGRRDLVESCPYGAIDWNEELSVPQKCTLCAHLLDTGWKEPRCVQSCPTGALKVVRLDDAEAARLATTEGLLPLHPEHGTKPTALYRSLARFEKCFVAGSVAAETNGVVDCVAGANVTLSRGAEVVATATTDAFGDFKLDGLEEGSGRYALAVSGPAGRGIRLEVEVTTSVSLGVVPI